MSVTPPEAKPEYSRAPRQSKMPAAISLPLLAGGLAGALLLLVAEFTPLYDRQSATSGIPVQTVQTGSHHAYALVPIAVLGIGLTLAAVRSRGPALPAQLALGALAVVTIVIALVGDLPDADAVGFVGSAARRLTQVKDVPQIGIYLETLGAALLVVTCGAGLLLTGSRGGPAAARGNSSRGGYES